MDHNATGRSRSGYTEIKDDQGSLAADRKKSGKQGAQRKRIKLKMYFCAIDYVRVSDLTLSAEGSGYRKLMDGCTLYA